MTLSNNSGDTYNIAITFFYYLLIAFERKIYLEFFSWFINISEILCVSEIYYI